MDRPVSKNDLRLGEEVHGDIVDAHGAVLVRKGTPVESETFVEFLLSCGARIRQDEPTAFAAAARPVSTFETIDTLGSELAQASLRPKELTEFVGSVQDIARKLSAAVENDPDASIASIFLVPCDSYSVRHQVHSAILCDLVANLAGIDALDRLSLVCGALTMNLAFLEYQDCLNERTGGLSSDEKETILKHPLIGEQILITAGVDDPLWLSCVRNHHEKRDGSGYPDGLSGDAIPRPAQILQIVDVFSARVSARSWSDKELANATMADLLRSTAGNQCDPDLVKSLIKALGAFPPGCFVKLANEENAIVVHRGQKATSPLVRSVSLAHLRYETPVPRDTSDSDYAIKALLPQDQVDIPGGLRSLWEKNPTKNERG